MSKEAFLGFGINLIGAANNYYVNNHYHVEPLGTLITNQAKEFFLTPESSPLVVGCKSFGVLSELEEKSMYRRVTAIVKVDRFSYDFAYNTVFCSCKPSYV